MSPRRAKGTAHGSSSAAATSRASRRRGRRARHCRVRGPAARARCRGQRAPPSSPGRQSCGCRSAPAADAVRGHAPPVRAPFRDGLCAAQAAAVGLFLPDLCCQLRVGLVGSGIADVVRLRAGRGAARPGGDRHRRGRRQHRLHAARRQVRRAQGSGRVGDPRHRRRACCRHDRSAPAPRAARARRGRRRPHHQLGRSKRARRLDLSERDPHHRGWLVGGDGARWIDRRAGRRRRNARVPLAGARRRVDGLPARARRDRSRSSLR